MCLGLPMRIVELANGTEGVAEMDGLRQPVDLSLIDGPARGDYVIVHAGFAIERLDEAEAEARIRLFEEWAATVPAPPAPS